MIKAKTTDNVDAGGKRVTPVDAGIPRGVGSITGA